MKNKLTVDFANNRIVMDRTFAQKAKDTHTDEYAHLQQVRLDYPQYKVIVRTIKKNTNKETYKGLTYEYMFRFLNAYHDERDIKKLEKKIFISECHRIRYPKVKKWFLEEYPDVKDMWDENNELQEPESNAMIKHNIFAAEANKEHAA